MKDEGSFLDYEKNTVSNLRRLYEMRSCLTGRYVDRDTWWEMSAFSKGIFVVFSPLPPPGAHSLKCVMLLTEAPFLIMDTKEPPSGMLHGHTAVGLETRGQRKLAVLLFTQSVLTCACAALCVYTLYKVHHFEQDWVSTETHTTTRTTIQSSFGGLLIFHTTFYFPYICIKRNLTYYCYMLLLLLMMMLLMGFPSVAFTFRYTEMKKKKKPFFFFAE